MGSHLAPLGRCDSSPVALGSSTLLARVLPRALLTSAALCVASISCAGEPAPSAPVPGGDGDATGDGDGDATGDGDGDGDGDGEPAGDGDGEPAGDGDGESVGDKDLAGNPNGTCAIPAEANLEDISEPTTVVGDGTPQSCTGQAVVAAVAQGGVIIFDCGNAPHTISMSESAKVVNDANDVVVIDGGGLVTLSGAGKTRVLYMNTCDEAQRFTTPHCDNQDHPRLTVQNITFANGNAKAQGEGIAASGGAIFASGGRFKAVNVRFINNHAAEAGPDVGGGALRVMQQFQGKPAYLTHCSFGGQPQYGNSASNGGAISSISVSWSIYNSLFSYNSAIGTGGNPALDGTPGGGSGGAIYNDGNTMTLHLCGTHIEHNRVTAFGDAIFFVSNNHTGNIVLEDSKLSNNCGGSWNPTYPSISNHDDTPIQLIDSHISGCDD